ncbi:MULTISPECIES: CU044_2847 family protein [Kitasatospora]|uniref:Trypsin-co-occurring domain-containing protein n=1 Tax=Kitasatospora setae (strain ATCC 33774 / DSM 43861 / JCM 3304 / KCC A-0304 / NBRC 14216 / KM-6054) TaxID=452652 RepID=E4N4T3_KITSK|nr:MULTISPECIES: CU044_2847 family protein [Kitasatospora]BAJ26214.1 hypothetical protein KSE_03670 [Kitasatospora setae KM-6054]
MQQQQLVELELPDGQTVWALVDGPSGPRDTGFGDQLATRVEGLRESLQAVASNVRDAVAAARPDEVSVEFGLELAAGRGGVVAALTGVGGKATFKVGLKWTSGGTPSAAVAPPEEAAAEAGSEPGSEPGAGAPAVES